MSMSKKNNKDKTPRTSIGGQAVLEGVMMRGKTAMATAVRDGDGVIRIESKRLKPKKSKILKLPFVRGIVAFISSFFTGTKVLMRSSEVFAEGEPSKFEKWLAEKLKVNIMSVVSTIALILGLAFAIFFFMWLPQFARTTIEGWCGEGFKFDLWAKNFIEGGLKLLIFVAYLLLVSLMKDIKRTFMYHGAEHKTISCYESCKDLTIENAKSCTRIHDRCGTTFMVFVLLVSILTFALVESLIGEGVEKAFRVLLKIALLPVVSGISYELLKLLSKTKSVLVLPLKLPGMLLQKITTKEPSDDMLEVAITAFKMVEKMDADQTIPEVEFIIPLKSKEVLEKTKKKLLDCGIEEDAEAEWIVSIVSGKRRSELNSDDYIKPKHIEKIQQITNERCSGRPLWYCIGDTEFYGYKIYVDERVLIPRPETELLVENVVKHVDKDKTVLDLCTGSGAIAIAVKKKSDALVTASDVSSEALELAKVNAIENNADIKFVLSDMLDEFIANNEKFDIVVSNPPYIRKGDLSSLQKEVKDFEPLLALDGGIDGLDFYREIAKNVKQCLNKNGILFLECGIGQAREIARMLSGGFSHVEILKDYENIDRIIKAVL